MPREASVMPGKLRIFHVLLRLVAVVSRLVPFPTEYSTRFVALSYMYVALRSLTMFTPFYYVCHVMLRLSRRVKFKDINGISWGQVPSYWSSHYSEQ